MRRKAALTSLALALIGAAIPAVGRPVDVVPFDSGTRVVREVAEALSGRGRSILESYPRGSEIFLGLVSLLPERTRIAAIEWGMRLSLGCNAGRAADVSVEDLAAWCTAQYPGSQPVPAIVLGSPNGGVAHLAALLGAPFLTTSFGLAFRHPAIEPEDIGAYRRTSASAAAAILDANAGEDIEIVCHYDPIHDRSMVQYVDFVRVKLRGLPLCYRDFIRERLAPDGILVLVDCCYEWPQIELDQGIFLQVGGLGAIDPAEYFERWKVDGPVRMRAESEWGCPSSFAIALSSFAAENGLELLEIERADPSGFSRLAYDAYLACDGVRSDRLLIDSFNHLNPRTNLETGIPGFWLPFNTADGLDVVDEILRAAGVDTVFLAPLPSFVQSRDTVSLSEWEGRISPWAKLEWIGVNPNLYPADPLAPYRFARDAANLRETLGRSTPLHLDVEAFRRLVTLHSERFGIVR